MPPRLSPPCERELALGGDRGRAGGAEHLRVGAAREALADFCAHGAPSFGFRNVAQAARAQIHVMTGRAARTLLCAGRRLDHGLVGLLIGTGLVMHLSTIGRAAIGGAAVSLILACSAPSPTGTGGTGGSGGAGGSGGTPTGLTYYKDIKPILDAKCARCHVPNSFAPFALQTLADASAHKDAIRGAVQSRYMPPWQFADGCNDYRGNYQMTDAERAMVIGWIDQGLAAGDPFSPGPPIDIDDVKLSRTDVTLTMPEAFTPTQSPDHYRCFPVAWPSQYTTRQFMTGFGAEPDNVKIVHHMEIYYVPPAEAQQAFAKDAADPGPGYTCFGGPGLGTGTIGGWAPGGQGYDYPNGIGIPIDPGSVLVIQVHYNTLYNAAGPDRSSVKFKVDQSAIKGGYNFWTNGVLSIPPGATDFPVSYSADPTGLLQGLPPGFRGTAPMSLYGGAVHMHNLGHRGQLTVHHASTNTDECVLMDDNWNFHWQSGVQLKQPIRVNPGDSIRVNCWFNNTTGRTVNWGESTQDEMCLGIIMWGPAQ